MKSLKYSLTALFSLFVLGAMQPVQADRALVVVVDQYPGLVDANLEGAGTNSVPLVKRMLVSRGIPEAGIKVLENTEATRANVLQALQEAKAQIAAGERFVFYFLGHGGRAFDRPVILPHDATMDASSPDIDNATLAAHLKAIRDKGCATTALLDSCFSEGMIATANSQESFRTHPRRRALFYNRPRLQGRQERIVRVNGKDGNEGSGVCYFVASARTEQAFADVVEGRMVGLFTHALSQRLTTPSQEAWGDVHRQVTASVANATEDTQHPVLSEGWFKITPFGRGEGPAPKPVFDLEQLMNTDRVDHGKLSLAMTPNKARLEVMERFSLEAVSGSGGYLLLLSRTTGGSIEVLFPSSLRSENARILPGVPVRLPEDGFFASDREGTERAKAFLFPTREAAEEVLSRLRKQAQQSSTILSGSANRSKRVGDTGIWAADIKIVGSGEFFTSSITLEIKGGK